MNQVHTYNCSDRNHRVEEIYPAVMESMVCVSYAENNHIIFFLFGIYFVIETNFHDKSLLCYLQYPQITHS